MKKDPNIPILKGFFREGGHPDDDGLIEVWCPFCKLFHTHGFMYSKDMSHRHAHCSSHNNNDASPFRKTGYYVTLYNPSRIKQAWEINNNNEL